jgi:hypothetical protein
VLDALFGTLAIELHLKPDLAAAEKKSRRWHAETKAKSIPDRISQAMLDRSIR